MTFHVERIDHVVLRVRDQAAMVRFYEQALGFKVERKLNLGGTPVAQVAITKGDIDLYPEYTSTGLLTTRDDFMNDSRQFFVKVSYLLRF